ncbi:c-type cytochrome [Lentibacter algarum]|uniref:c-type cytochrome n=1 Tax=Lentibacter algarum TaxID=576131 RepID=UPI00209126BC|nr:cytochrome c [Lentibacter algarum]
MAAFTAACMNVAMPDASEGAQVYANNCAMCHGQSGRGDGVLAADLSVKPANLTQLTRDNDGAFPVNQVLSYIDGYSRQAREDVEMPEFGLMLKGPSVPIATGDGVMTPTPRPLAALLAYLESIQQ